LCYQVLYSANLINLSNDRFISAFGRFTMPGHAINYYFCNSSGTFLHTKVGPIVMKIALLQVGKTSEKYLSEGINVYTGRLSRYLPFEIVTVPEIKNSRNMPAGEQKEKEGEGILRLLKDDDFVVVLDEKGKEFSTMEFSSWLGKSLMLQKKRIVFIAGGPWGVSSQLMSRSDLSLSLSRMTFSHQIVRLLFLEQLYRAFTIIKGEPYHHE